MSANPYPVCCCLKCGPPWRESRPEPAEDASWVDRITWGSWMAVCPVCGDKRCPGAGDHDGHPQA